ncbi:hypothetical protein, partial [Lactococcus cremoris]|uniref:hypothetical protein n=1 Tax=Lactococcus lactis subsp. cremoris TaxID=1359 RepID=UPI0019D3BDE2
LNSVSSFSLTFQGLFLKQNIPLNSNSRLFKIILIGFGVEVNTFLHRNNRLNRYQIIESSVHAYYARSIKEFKR